MLPPDQGYRDLRRQLPNALREGFLPHLVTLDVVYRGDLVRLLQGGVLEDGILLYLLNAKERPVPHDEAEVLVCHLGTRLDHGHVD